MGQNSEKIWRGSSIVVKGLDRFVCDSVRGAGLIYPSINRLQLDLISTEEKFQKPSIFMECIHQQNPKLHWIILKTIQILKKFSHKMMHELFITGEK